MSTLASSGLPNHPHGHASQRSSHAGSTCVYMPLNQSSVLASLRGYAKFVLQRSCHCCSGLMSAQPVLLTKIRLTSDTFQNLMPALSGQKLGSGFILDTHVQRRTNGSTLGCASISGLSHAVSLMTVSSSDTSKIRLGRQLLAQTWASDLGGDMDTGRGWAVSACQGVHP